MLRQASIHRGFVGLLDFFRRWTRTAAEPVPPIIDYAGEVRAAVDVNKLPPSVVSMAAKGISGTTNFFGDVLSESNSKLIHQLAFGTPGNRTWGEWEKILLTDPAVHMAVEFVTAPLRDALVDVVAAPEASMPDRRSAAMHADFVKWNLLEALEPSWAEIIQQMTQGALVFGFSMHERVFSACSHRLLPRGTGYMLSKLAQRLPVSIHTNGWIERDGDLDQIRQWGMSNDGDGRWRDIVLSADDVLLMSWNRRGNNYLGHSAFRAVWYLCKIREELAKLIGVALSREGAGVPVAFATEKSAELDAKQRNDFQTLMANLVYHENASAVLPAGWDMKWVFSPAANKGHVVDAYNALGLTILQQVQAQQLALGVNDTGSRSVGEVHSSSSDSFVSGIAANIEGVINGVGSRRYTGVARQLIDINYGPQAAYPRVSISLRQAKLSVTGFASTIKAMRDGKVLTVWTIDDENSAREKTGLQKVTAKQWEEAMARRESVADMPAPPDDATNNDGPTAPAVARMAAGGPWTPRRELRDAERHCAWADMAQYLDGAKHAFERGAKPLVVAMLAKALPSVRSAVADGVLDHDEVAALSLDVGDLSAFVAKWLDGVRREGYRHVANEMSRASATQRPRTTADDDIPSIPQDEAPTDPPDELARLVEAQRKQLVRRIESRLRAEIEEAAIDVERTDGDAAEIVSEVVARQIETKALQSDAGSVMTRAFNLGREEFAQEYADAVESVELSSLLDDGTCGPCESMDGTEFEFGSDEYERNTPPLRICDGRGKCRCVYVYKFRR